MKQLDQRDGENKPQQNVLFPPNPEANHGCIRWLELSGENRELEHHSAKPLFFNSNFHQKKATPLHVYLFIYLLNLLSASTDIYLKQMYSRFKNTFVLEQAKLHEA